MRTRLSTHLKLDQVIWIALKRYVLYHPGDGVYWEENCKPYVNLLPEHCRLTQLTSHRLKHYSQHLVKMTQLCPRQRPSQRRAKAFLALVEKWYWREYP